MPSAKTIYEVAELIDKYYDKPGNSTGGNLHIVLDDGNTSGRFVLFCLRQAEKARDVDGVVLAEALLDMDESEREFVLTPAAREYASAATVAWGTKPSLDPAFGPCFCGSECPANLRPLHRRIYDQPTGMTDK